MRHRRLLWRIYLSFLGATLVALVATAWYATHSLRLFHEEQVASDLRVRAEIVAQDLRDRGGTVDPAAVDRLSKELGRLTATRITVILPTGVVIADSETDPAAMENHRDRPEVVQALQGRQAFGPELPGLGSRGVQQYDYVVRAGG